MVARTVSRLVAPLSRRVRLMARRAVVKLVYDDPKMQELQLAIFSGEVRDRVERWEDYGFSSHPIPGAEALVLALGGNTDHGAVVKVGDRRYRIRGLAQGEVAFYDDQGQVVHLKRDKTIHVYGCDRLAADVAVETEVVCPLVTVTASSKVTFDTPLVEFTGNATFAGDVAVANSGQFGGGLIMTGAAGTGNISTPGDVSDGDGSMAGIRSTYNEHDHPGDSGGTTGTPNQEM